MRIGLGAFNGCCRLTQLAIPANIEEIGGDCHSVFKGVTTLERVTLIGRPLTSAVVEAVVPALASTAKVIGPALAGQRFGHFMIVAGSDSDSDPGSDEGKEGSAEGGGAAGHAAVG
jgi:hypothetical protein